MCLGLQETRSSRQELGMLSQLLLPVICPDSCRGISAASKSAPKPPPAQYPGLTAKQLQCLFAVCHAES